MQQKQLHIPGKRLKHYEIVKLIGSGGYCKVYHAVNVQTNENVAIKAVAMSTFKNHGGLVGQLHETEKQNMKLIKSNYVVKFIDEFQQNKYSYIVMEYCNQGDIEKLWLDKNKHFSEQEAIVYVKQMLKGMQDLQKCYVMHRDIKMKNILRPGIQQVYFLTLCIQYNNDNPMTLTIGMLGYMAPEVVQSKQYNNTADIFSLGCLFYLMIYGELPFSDQNHQIYLYETKNKKIIHHENTKTSEKTQFILNSMLEYDQDKRIAWTELYKYFDQM
ncbi:unnamed protein product (macronuclear) [Paramecium tetraurelia]|uniref:Protein kinase domain-containing protein n=1 Tax=Paramecium tetraurelia TaxID=5888 RepID=A0CQQ1_PARTE|nr:uncharacterized protein GSPATT00009466001 [Paramecium tetraurelia]CAK73118.1 unnamed protein product [Paramecium tetraurelia]|eukprot:XP_001440515.1 hypothetical protein (macronuclear) [Paramecium tetraurelia strain d4-2]